MKKVLIALFIANITILGVCCHTHKRFVSEAKTYKETHIHMLISDTIIQNYTKNIKDTFPTFSKDCEEICILIKNNWRFDETKNEYRFSDDNIKQICLKQICFMGKSRDEIVYIFGKPTYLGSASDKYEFKSCRTILETGYCHWLEFVYNIGLLTEKR